MSWYRIYFFNQFDNKTRLSFQILKYYSSSSLFVQVYGLQKAVSNETNKLSTREWFENERKTKQNSTELLRDVNNFESIIYFFSIKYFAFLKEINKLRDELDKNKKKFVSFFLKYLE